MYGYKARTVIFSFWRLLKEYPRCYAGLALLVQALIIALVSLRFEVQTPLIQFLLGAREIVATRQIASTFLPIGYQALLGWAMILGLSHGTHGVYASVLTLQIGIALLVVVFSRSILLQNMPARTATSLALLIGLNPRVVANVFSATDTNLSLVLLLALLAYVAELRQTGGLRHAILVGAALGCGILVRPNLLIMVVLPIWAVWCLPFGKTATILFTTIAACLLTYAGMTALVHGKPFYPHNGPYNMFAGFNEFTEEELLRHFNGEESIVPALANFGIATTLDWRRQPDIPGVNDCRDKSYESFYTNAAKSFIRRHPKQSVRLTLLKLETLFHVGDVRKIQGGRSNKLMRSAKIVSFMVALPLWLALMAYSIARSLHFGSTPVLLMSVLYVLPFALSNSDPRFRIALEGVVMTDIVRILYLLHSKRQSGWRNKLV